MIRITALRGDRAEQVGEKRCHLGCSASMARFSGLNVQGADQPGNDDLFKDDRIGPYLYLSSEVAALRIDPCRFWDVTFIPQQVDVRDRNLRVQNSGDD